MSETWKAEDRWPEYVQSQTPPSHVVSSPYPHPRPVRTEYNKGGELVVTEWSKPESLYPEPVAGPESVTLKIAVLGTVSGDNARVLFHGEQSVQPEGDRNL